MWKDISRFRLSQRPIREMSFHMQRKNDAPAQAFTVSKPKRICELSVTDCKCACIFVLKSLLSLLCVHEYLFTGMGLM
jgi:hypothetical protein